MKSVEAVTSGLQKDAKEFRARLRAELQNIVAGHGTASAGGRLAIARANNPGEPTIKEQLGAVADQLEAVDEMVAQLRDLDTRMLQVERRLDEAFSATPGQAAGTFPSPRLDKDIHTSLDSRRPVMTPSGSPSKLSGPAVVAEHANALGEPQTWERQHHEPQDQPRVMQHMNVDSSPRQRLAPPLPPFQAVQQEQVQQQLRPNRSSADDRPLGLHKQDTAQGSSHDLHRQRSDSSARSSCEIAISPDESVEDVLQLQRRCDATEDVTPLVQPRQSSPSRTSGSRSHSVRSEGSHRRSRRADPESGSEGQRGPRSGRGEALPSRLRQESPAQPARSASGSEQSGPPQSHHAGFVPGSDGSGYDPRAVESDGMSHESFHESVDEVFSDE